MTKTFEQTLERYLQRWRPTLRPSTLLNKRSVLEIFTAYLCEHHPDVHSFSQLQRRPILDSTSTVRMPMRPTEGILFRSILQPRLKEAAVGATWMTASLPAGISSL